MLDSVSLCLCLAVGWVWLTQTNSRHRYSHILQLEVVLEGIGRDEPQFAEGNGAVDRRTHGLVTTQGWAAVVFPLYLSLYLTSYWPCSSTLLMTKRCQHMLREIKACLFLFIQVKKTTTTTLCPVEFRMDNWKILFRPAVICYLTKSVSSANCNLLAFGIWD